MPKARFTSEAEHDLLKIAHYIALDNAAAAASWLQNTRAVCGSASRGNCYRKLGAIRTFSYRH
jgi:plasmid stabilization system protein ParE